jgi:hypothetical protein
MTAAIQYLEAHFEQAVKRHAGGFRYAPAYRQWRGPSEVRPMIEFLSVMDAGKPMRIVPSDYADPGWVCL